MNGYEIVATVVVIPLITFLKRQWAIEGPFAFWLSVVVSFLAALVVFLFDGEGFSLENFFGSLIKIFAGAQMIYNIVKQTPAARVIK